MDEIKIEDMLRAYVGLRDEIAAREKAFKAWKNERQGQMDKIELYIMAKCDELGLDNVSGGGFTAYRQVKDSVTIANRTEFSEFLVRVLLTNLQPHMYFYASGEYTPDGKSTLDEHIKTVLEFGTLDLLTLSANKTNCKEYMAAHKGLMPDGVDYTKTQAITIRKTPRNQK